MLILTALFTANIQRATGKLMLFQESSRMTKVITDLASLLILDKTVMLCELKQSCYV